ncbi:hypothetical protein CEE37_13055 [candidate division LCP-89 bacterium B3_LCP]|uniref:Uncharacterized protein n=1 Tax=candidate division LCP-89 bacterium B3_LCP TaxID=2012998 RepID=A0A532UU20_UNCL8|nr:MAG: hypothetical protein CEE37_13055 [candidate division LCP-89 bacterium B3_LCP]
MFGAVTVGQDLTLPLTIYNYGELELVIYDVFTSDPCYTTDYNEADSLVAAGDSLGINVTFTPTEAGPYIETLTIENNDETVEVGLLGIGEGSAGITPVEVDNQPDRFALYPPYPNPFNPETTISYSLPMAGMVNLSVYDISGSRVANLVNGWRLVGTHELTFDASKLSDGVYIARLIVGDFQQTRKLMLVK